jgi:hypothetical protein
MIDRDTSEQDVNNSGEELERELLEAGADPEAGSAGTEGQDGAGSPAAQTQEPERDLLSIVRDAAPAKPKEGDAASSAEGAEGDQRPGKGAPKEPDNEGYSDVPFHKHPRFRQLLNERNGYKPDAEKYRQVDRFIRDNGLSNEEAANLLHVGALAKTDPSKAWEMVKPWVSSLLSAAGEVLPEDLKQMVEQGQMSEAAAYEVSRSRASVTASTTQRQFEERRREMSAQEQAQADYQGAAVSWEQDRRAKDPNFEAKLEPILREIAWRKSQGDIPKTPAEVTAQLNDVYKAVNASLRPAPTAAPARQGAAPVRRNLTPITGGTVGGGDPKPKPKSMLEVVQQGQGG